jgi:SAM-dependent methyltransferase
MTRIWTSAELDCLLLPGVPADYLGTPILLDSLCTLVSQPEVVHALLADKFPLPTTEGREGYFGPRHLEYWLSGQRDARSFAATLGSTLSEAPRILDFGGATGRLARHVVHLFPTAEVFLSDINPRHVACSQRMFGTALRIFRNHSVPSLPLPDGFLDAACAFSVVTHMDSDDTAWLLELRRVVRSGGTIYITVHDERTWGQLPTLYPMNAAFSDPDLVALRERTPDLSGKVVHYYNENVDYACNAFVSREHIEKVWSPLFASCRIESMAHDHQAAVVFRVP